MRVHQVYTGMICGGFINLLEDYCNDHAIEAPTLLKQILGRDRCEFYLWRSALQQIFKLQPTPHFGLELVKSLQLKHLGVIGYMMTNCFNFAEALQKYNEFHQLIYDQQPFRFQVYQHKFHIHWKHLAQYPCDPVLDEFAVALIVFFFRECLTTQLPILEVQFRHQPHPQYLTQYQHYEKLLNCSIQFCKPYMQIVLSADCLNIAMKQSDQTLKNLLNKQALEQMHALSNSTTLQERLEQSIRKGLQRNQHQIEYVASQLKLSTRQLQRYLHQKNTTYQQVLQDVRKNLALVYLQQNHLSLQEISLLLSYSEQSAFQRAFKQWMGLTPQQWRSVKYKI